PIISCNTVVALFSRSVASSRADPAQHSVPRLNIASTKIAFFMNSLISVTGGTRLWLHAVCTRTQIRIDMPGAPEQFDISKSGFRRSEQKCSHGLNGIADKSGSVPV